MNRVIRVAIIGGAGFIGSRLAKRLSDNSLIKFSILDKVVSKLYPNLSVLCDIENKEQLRSSLASGFDVVVNLAAEHKDNVFPVKKYHNVNVVGQDNICQIMEEFNINRHIFTSSVAVYGFVNKEVFENCEYAPFHDYGRSKLDAEQVLTRWYDNAGIQNSIVRPTVVFGERNRGNVFNLLKQIASGRFVMIGDGQNKKSMAYVENVAALLEFLIEKGEGHQVFNYADKPDYTMNELYSEVNRVLGIKARKLKLPYWVGLLVGYIFDVLAKVLRRNFSISSIRVKKFCAVTQFGSTKIPSVGFVPPVPLVKGLEKTLRNEFL